MNITQEEVVDSQTVLHVELEDEDLDKYIDRGYRKVVQRVPIPGFRKGKAPRRVVENYVGRESLLNEVLDSMLPEVAGLAITQQELDAAGLPQIELLDLDPLTLKATVPLAPDVDLGPYRDIRVPEVPVEVGEEEVKERLEQLRRGMTSWEPVDRPVKMGDTVTMTVTGVSEGRTILDLKDALYYLDEEASGPTPDFPEHLVGAKKDEPIEFSLVIPEDYSDETIAGKESHFTVTMSEIKEGILPDLDNEFAKSVGDEHESLDDLRREIEKELRADAESRTTLQYRESVISAVLEGTKVQLAPLLIDHEIAHMQDDQARILGRANVRMDDYLQSVGKTEEDLRGEMRERAVERLNRTFVLSKVAELEEVDVSGQEVQDRLESILTESGEQSQSGQVSEELRESVRRMLLGDKTVERLTTIARGYTQVQDRTADESSGNNQSLEEGDGADDKDA